MTTGDDNYYPMSSCRKKDQSRVKRVDKDNIRAKRKALYEKIMTTSNTVVVCCHE